MIFEWMMYSILAAVGFSVAAVIAERQLLRGRAPVRVVWSSAIALSFIVPLLALAITLVPSPTAVSQPIEPSTPNAADISAISVPLSVAVPPIAEPSTFTRALAHWRDEVTSWDGPLAALWAALTLVLAINVAGGGLALARMRRRWRATTVLSVPVLVSPNVGPAVVGMRAPVIVIPEWVLDLVPTQLALLLQHEEEHRRARDGQLLGVARLALLLMPWNLVLYWQLRRLRIAVELDCDARVLSRADAREYGDLLLRVARAGHGASLAGATAFAERATQLERRIRVLSRHRHRASRVSVIVASCVGLVAMSAAWVAPHPDAPKLPRSVLVTSSSPRHALQERVVQPRRASADSQMRQEAVRVGTRDTIRMRLMARDSITRDSITRNSLNSVRTDNERRMRGDSAKSRLAIRTMRGDTVVQRDRSITFDGRIIRGDTVLNVQGAAIIREIDRPIDSVVAQLLQGVSASPEQTVRVREILLAARDRQRFEAAVAPAVVQRTIALIAARDSAFRALLTNDDDRTRFDALASERPGLRLGGGARSGGARSGGAGTGAPGARSGGSGARLGRASGDSLVAIPRSPDGGARGRSGGDPDAQLARLFDGIALSPSQVADARAILQRTQAAVAQAQSSAMTTAPVIGVDVVSGRIAVSAPYSESILALFSVESARATIRSRLALLPP